MRAKTFYAVIEETQKVRVYCTVIAKDAEEARKLIEKHKTETEEEIETKVLKRWKMLVAPKLATSHGKKMKQ